MRNYRSTFFRVGFRCIVFGFQPFCNEYEPIQIRNWLMDLGVRPSGSTATSRHPSREGRERGDRERARERETEREGPRDSRANRDEMRCHICSDEASRDGTAAARVPLPRGVEGQAPPWMARRQGRGPRQGRGQGQTVSLRLLPMALSLRLTLPPRLSAFPSLRRVFHLALSLCLPSQVLSLRLALTQAFSLPFPARHTVQWTVLYSSSIHRKKGAGDI